MSPRHPFCDSEVNNLARDGCAPFGSPGRPLWVIGHDPRLRESHAHAAIAFFLDYLLHPRPTQPGEAAKYGLAEALLKYLSALIGRHVTPDEIYVTNLCNQFLPRPTPGKTVLIPDQIADMTIQGLAEAAQRTPPKLILSMSAQVTYHLARQQFIVAQSSFLTDAAPTQVDATRGAYTASRTRAFVPICGELFKHEGTIPVIPILHVVHWPLPQGLRAYSAPMKNAEANIRKVYQ